MGAAIKPVKKMYADESPGSWCRRIALPPANIMTTPSAPTTTVARR